MSSRESARAVLDELSGYDEWEASRAETRKAVEVLFRHSERSRYRNELGGFFWEVHYGGRRVADGGCSGPDVTREYADAVRRRFVRAALKVLRDIAQEEK
jgi:hypothetical protein